MSEKHRALPSWMSKTEEKAKEKEPLKSRRKKKAARAAFYCMNEKELVEAAVSCLTNSPCVDVPLRTHQQVEEKAMKREKPSTPQMTAKPATEPLEEGSSDCGDDPDMTYCSETDLDITEVETVPTAQRWKQSPQHSGSEGQRSGPLQDRGRLMDVVVVAEKGQEQSQTAARAGEEDDAFQLVREIFFS